MKNINILGLLVFYGLAAGVQFGLRHGGLDFYDRMDWPFLQMFAVAVLVLGAVLVFLYKELLRFHPAVIPILTATLTVLGALGNGILNLHPGAQAGTVFACIIVYAIAYLWYQELLKAPEEKATG